MDQGREEERRGLDTQEQTKHHHPTAYAENQSGM